LTGVLQHARWPSPFVASDEEHESGIVKIDLLEDESQVASHDDSGRVRVVELSFELFDVGGDPLEGTRCHALSS
jgi:hypothetical protein